MIIYSGNHSLPQKVLQHTGIDGVIGLLTSYPNKPPLNSNYPFVIDNKRYSVWTKGIKWEQNSYIKILNYLVLNNMHPRWILCPDVPEDAAATNKEWRNFYPLLSCYPFPLAFAVQDGHEPKDVPKQAEFIFIGGTTKWKRQNIKTFCDAFPNRVHVGRINSLRWLWVCHHAGVSSIDGNGWFRTAPGSSTYGRSCFQDLCDYIKIVHGIQDKESNCLFHLGQYTQYAGILP